MTESAAVYAQAALAYHQSGWCQPVPLPYRKKTPPDPGFTGEGGREPTIEEIREWIHRRAQCNIGARLRRGRIGLDVDAHKGPAELEAWNEQLARCGPLPDAPRSTSRGFAGESGIRLFRVPDDYIAKGALAWGETVQWWYRYIIVSPSVVDPPKGNGEPYQWESGHIPSDDEIPWLPQAWLDDLRAEQPASNGQGFQQPPDGHTHKPGWTAPDIPWLRRNGCKPGSRHDQLRDVVATLAGQGTDDTTIEAIWWEIYHKTPPKDPPKTREDFLGHLSTARDNKKWTPSEPAEGGSGRHRTTAAAEPIPAVALKEAIDVFRRWLHLTDTAPLLATAAALVANKAEGDPVWLLLVGAPSTGKTEVLSASAGLPWIHPAARVTEAALLSGTSAKERARSATGGLLRQVGDFGVLLCKDFTSVLAQNKDTSAEALAALREVYDGSWDRPVGTDGGRVLHWSGKCGLVGGVTPALDRYQAILSALGDRFLLLRLADAEQQESAEMALTHQGVEKTMRAELAAALCGLVDSADPARINDPLTGGDKQRLIDLASFTARARTAVMRDGYTRELLYLPQVEGPGRLVTAYARMLGALRAIGCDDKAAWQVLDRIAVSCMTAARAAFARALASRHTAERTAELCLAVGMTTKHGRDHLEDLALIGLAKRSKTSDASNAPDLWEATEALRAAKWVPINTPHPLAPVKEEAAERSAQNGSLQPPVFLGPALAAPACARHQLIGCDCEASR